MKIIHKNIDFETYRNYVLECHCQINYECDSPWARNIPYEEYRNNWFALKNQANSFFTYLIDTAENEKTIAEIIHNEKGENIGYLWVPFITDVESGFCFAEIQDIFIEKAYRQTGIASELMRYAENKAKANGAKVIRSGTGCENEASIKMHKKHGYYQYRLEFEKEL